jgi:tetratricopeptide (TPR) repeat protein
VGSYRFRLFLFLLLLGPTAAPVFAGLAEADQAYAERADVNKARIALELYQKSIDEKPATPEAYWKGSRAAWWVGDQSDDHKERMNFFNLGISLAQEAIKHDANSVEGHFWLGANYGSFGETKGVLKSLFLLKPIRQEMDTVVRLNPTFEGGAGTRVLGVVDYKVPGFAGGDKKRAEERLLTAYKIDPKNPITVYYLGEYYATVGNKEKGREYLNSLTTLEVVPEFKPELLEMQKKAAKLLTTLEK